MSLNQESPDESSAHVFCQCSGAACRFRFPATEAEQIAGACPLCGADTSVVARVNRDEARSGWGGSVSSLVLLALVDNLRSVYNVGSVFRSADGVGVGHLFLCGITPTPQHRRLAKTALGAETEVKWSHYTNGVEQAKRLRADGVELVALETSRKATSLFDYDPTLSGHPICLVIGNEVTGIDPGIMDICDHVLEIPMRGLKRTLNVSIAFSVAAYWLRSHCP